MDKLLPKQLEVQRQLDAADRAAKDLQQLDVQRQLDAQDRQAKRVNPQVDGNAEGLYASLAGGVKFDSDKPRMDLLDAYAIEQLAQVLTFGASKYAAQNWRHGISKSRLLAAAFRHLFAYLRGEDKDRESGLSHVAHAMCCCMFLLGLEHRADLDDRWKESA